jgi:CMP-N,N'-diacetyllegionaminic acid synthase
VNRPAIAIILGRAGSKGVPGKNAMPIAGKPCAQWTIEHALASTLVGRIVLSSDDPVLRSLALSMNAEAIDRPAYLATDGARVDDAARDAITTLDHRHNSARHSPGIAIDDATPIVLLYANVPVRPVGLIDRAVQRMLDTACDSVQSYAPVGKMHPWWTARVDGQTGHVRPWEGEVLNHGVYRRQELPPAYIPDGGVLVVSRRALFGRIPGVPPGPHAFFGADRRGVLTGEGEVVDIDSAMDALVATALLGGMT